MRLQTTSPLLCKLSETACEVSNKTGDVRGLFSLICPLWQVLDGYPDTGALGTQMSGVCLSNMSFRVPRRLSHRLWTRLEFKGLDSCLPSSARPGSPGEEDISWVFHGALLGSRTLLGHLEFRFFPPTAGTEQINAHQGSLLLFHSLNVSFVELKCIPLE